MDGKYFGITCDVKTIIQIRPKRSAIIAKVDCRMLNVARLSNSRLSKSSARAHLDASLSQFVMRCSISYHQSFFRNSGLLHRSDIATTDVVKIDNDFGESNRHHERCVAFVKLLAPTTTHQIGSQLDRYLGISREKTMGIF
jgi:hypothetical protein